jgi:hypothetical protein
MNTRPPFLHRVNDILSGPYRAKFSHTFLCIIKRWHPLYEVETAIALHFVDAERQRAKLRLGMGLLYGGQWRDYRTEIGN